MGEMNKHQAGRLRRVLESDAFAEFLTEQMGFDCRSTVSGSIRYGNDYARLNVSISTAVDDSGEVVDPDKVEWDRVCRSYGLNPEDFGKVISLRGTRFRLTGIKTRNRKYPILAQRCTDGSSFKLPKFAVTQAIREVGFVG